MRNFLLTMMLCAFSLGCGPLALQHGARTVPKGKTAAGASMLVVHEIGQGDAKDTSRTQMGQSAGFVRWGLHDQLDAGLQVYPGGVRADIKLMFVSNETVAVSMNPGVHAGYYRTHSEDPDFEDDSNGTMTGFDMTFAIARKMGDAGEVWVAPRFGSFTLENHSRSKDEFGTDKSDFNYSYRGWGAGVGAKVKMTDTLWLVPELGVYQRETKVAGFNNRGLSWVPAIGFATGF